MRPYNSLIELRPREDLDRKWNSNVIVTPDSALTSADSLTIGERRDAACVLEVVALGDGSPDCPDMSTVSPGDIVIAPLYAASKVLVLEKTIHLLAGARTLAAVIRNLGHPNESIQAINDYVLTREAREDFERIMHGGLILPDDYVSDGIPVDAGTAGIVRICLERCMSTGGGTFVKRKKWTPKQRAGELLGFNPLASCRFRRQGTWYRLTPAEDVQFGIDG